MKNILLSSAAIVAFAGAASAEITWTGSAELGYNDDYSDGVYVDADVDIIASQELNNGWTATLTYGFELRQNDNDGATTDDANDDDNLTLSLSNDMFTLTYGDTEYAAVSYWNGVSDMAFDGFSEVDDEDVLKADVVYGDYTFGVSAAVDQNGETAQVGFGATATFGMFNVSLAYQEEEDGVGISDPDIIANLTSNGGDFNPNEVLGISVGMNYAGADILLAYAQEDDGTDTEESIGIQVSYPVGPVTLTGYYVSESETSAVYGDDYTYGLTAAYADGPIELVAHYESARGEEEYNLEGSYDFGSGLVVKAGYIDGDDAGDDDFAAYVAAHYDLGGGAGFYASYFDPNSAAAETSDEIEIFDGSEYKPGATLALTFEF